MATTNIRGRQIRDTDVTRADLNTTISGSAVITRLFGNASAAITLTSTGADTGTGDVTITLATASASQLGGIKVGSGLAIDGTGVLSIAAGQGAAAIRTTQKFTATAGQTVFTISGGYTAGLIDVYVNGSLLNSDTVTASNGSTITLIDPAVAGDIIDVTRYTPTVSGFIGPSSDFFTEGTTNLFFTNARARAAISLTTTGTSGAATYDSATGILNIPQYQAVLGYTAANDANVVHISGTETITGSKTFSSTLNASLLSLNGGGLVGNNIVSMRANPTGGQFRIEKSDGSLSAYPFYVGADGTALAYYYNTAGALMVLLHTDGTSYFGKNVGIGQTSYAAVTEMLEVNGYVKATGFKTGGTSAQFLKADGSVDSSVYLTTSSASATYQTILTNAVTGTGSVGQIPKFTATSGLGNSAIGDSGTTVSITARDFYLDGFFTGTVNRVLPTGNTFVGQTFNLTGSANGWSVVSRNTWNINDDAFTANGFVVTDNRAIINRSSTATNYWGAYTGNIINNGSATQSGVVYFGAAGGSGNFNTAIIYRAGGSGPFSNTNTYTNYYVFDSSFTPLNITNFYGLNINDVSASTVARALNLSISSGTGKYNIYAQGTADNYLAGALGIGTTSLTGNNLRIAKSLTGATASVSVRNESSALSDVTSSATAYQSSIGTQAATFTMNGLYHYAAFQGTFGSGSTVTNQYGYYVDGNLTGAGTNYGFYGNIASGTGRWNLYMAGTANNYLAGSLGIGSTALTGINFRITKNITGATTSYGIYNEGVIQSDVTSLAIVNQAVTSTAAATFTLGSLMYYQAFQQTFGAGSTVTTQAGFSVSSTLVGATNNYGFRSLIPSGTGRWNLYMDGTAQNYLAGALSIGVTTANASALLQVDSTTQGFLPPRMTAAQRTAISSPATGLVVYQTDGTEGLYIKTASAWRALAMI